MTLGHPLRLGIFGLMLRAIRSEFSDYSLIKVSVPNALAPSALSANPRHRKIAGQ